MLTYGRSMKPLPLLVLALLTSALLIALWFGLSGTNGPAEWQWPAHSPELALAATLCAAAAFLVIVAAIAGWPSSTRWALPMLLGGGALFTLAVVSAQQGGWERVFAALASRNSFGFVWDAGLAPSTQELLADYPAASAALNQHSVTHPPGPLLAVRVLDRAVRGWSPDPQAAAPGGFREAAQRALAQERSRARAHGRPLPARLPVAATLVALAFLLPLAATLAAWPLHALAMAAGLERDDALLAAGLWLLVPARTLFTPSLDQALPLLLLSAAWLATRRSWTALAAAGLLLWGAAFLSYGCLAFVPLALALAVDPPDGWRSGAARSAVLLGALLLPWAVLALVTGFEPWAAMRAALALHERIAVAPRSYWTWLLGNPYDFVLLLGPPVLALAAWRRRSPPGAADEGRGERLRARLWIAFWLLLGVLWLSGSVRGEVGRIWLPWMPVAALLAAAAAGSEGRRRVTAAVLLGLEMLLTLTLAATLTFVS